MFFFFDRLQYFPTDVFRTDFFLQAQPALQPVRFYIYIYALAANLPDTFARTDHKRQDDEILDTSNGVQRINSGERYYSLKLLLCLNNMF